jgi:hypothetical protein
MFCSLCDNGRSVRDCLALDMHAPNEMGEGTDRGRV